mgnify:FL=1
MKIPVDIPAVLSAALDIDRASSIPVSVNILIDETASPDFQVFVRAGFNSESPNSRVMVSYFPTQTPDTHLGCDLTIIAAAKNESVGALAQEFRDQGTPVLVVAENGEEVCTLAEKTGYTLPEHDVVYVQSTEFDDELKGELAQKIGTWIVSAVDTDKKLAFSIAYPFVRRLLAIDAISQTALQNAGIGVVVFVPGADMPLMTANQIKMILQIAAAYGQPLGPERVLELLGVLVNAFIFRNISRQLAGLVPALGWAVKGTMGYLGTQAIGRAAIEYFEGGGNVAGLVALAGKATNETAKVVTFVQSEPTLRNVGEKVAPVARKAVSVALDAVVPVAQSAGKTILSSLKPGVRK